MIISENWQIEIRQNPATLGFQLFIFRRLPGEKVGILQQDGGIKEYPNGEADAKPTMILTSEMLKPFADALDSIGVRSDKDAMIEGTLKAQGHHLEDMRVLLKLSDKKPS